MRLILEVPLKEKDYFKSDFSNSKQRKITRSHNGNVTGVGPTREKGPRARDGLVRTRPRAAPGFAEEGARRGVKGKRTGFSFEDENCVTPAR